jgi:hypothetical protein
MENIGDMLSGTMLITAAAMIAIGSFITAFLHGLGFSIFGFNNIKPSYMRRYILQIFSVLVSYILCMGGAGLPWDKILSNIGVPSSFISNPKLMMVSLFALGAIFVSLIFHASLSIATYLIFDAKGNGGAALKTPSIISALTFIIFLTPAIMLVFQ